MLKLYIITTLISCIVVLVNGLAIKNKLLREGYKVKKTKISIPEWLRSFFILCIPILNIIMAVTMLLLEEETLKEVFIESFVKEG